MKNVYDRDNPVAVQIGHFPNGGRQVYTREPFVDADGEAGESAVLLFMPTREEALRIAQGGAVEVRVDGVVTPPLLRVGVSPVGQARVSVDDGHARILYEAGGGYPVSWHDVDETIRDLFRERARALWAAFQAATQEGRS